MSVRRVCFASILLNPCLAILLVLCLAVVQSNVAAQIPQPPVWTTTPVVRIDAKTENLLPTGSKIAVSQTGTIALSQRQGMHFLIFDSRGRRLGTAGRAGSGPGEFADRGLTYGWVADSLWVAEVYGRRVSLFAKDGRFVRELNVARPSQGQSPQRQPLYFGNPMLEAIYPSGAGSLIMAITSPRGLSVRCPCLLNVSADEKQYKLVAESPPTVNGQVAVRGGSWKVPFSWSAAWDAAPDGRFVAAVYATSSDRSGGAFRVSLVRSSGDTVFTRSYPAARARIPAARIDGALASLRRDPAAPIAEMGRLVPSEYRPFENIVVGRDATVWVQLRSTNGELPWLVLDAAGNAIGRISVKSNMRLVEAERGRVWVIEEDADGLESVVVLNVVSPR